MCFLFFKNILRTSSETEKIWKKDTCFSIMVFLIAFLLYENIFKNVCCEQDFKEYLSLQSDQNSNNL